MVGYYPQLHDGELLYSATARLAGAIFSGRGVPYCAERLLGQKHASFGFLIPNHVDKLLENIPAVSALAREAVLQASTFYLQAPLLDERERLSLLQSMFATGSNQGLRTFSARGAPTVLKYCVACARRDADLGRPAIWRVLHNHPGSVGCVEHGIQLQASDAPIGRKVLCDPAHWIKHDVALPPILTGAELAISQDFAWIYAQRGKLAPGFRPIASKLQDGLLSRPELTLAGGFLDPTKLLRAARDSLSEPSRVTFAPQLRQLAQGRRLPTYFRTTLHAYCLYAYLAGTSLNEILTSLAKENPEAISLNTRRRRQDMRVLFHKRRLEDFTVRHPGCTRSHLHAALAHSIEIAQREDRDWYEMTMPESRSRRPRGPRLYRDWNDRDSKLCALISGYMATSGTAPFQSFRDALQKLGQSRSLMRREHGRLPKSRALLASLITPIQTAA